MEGPEYQGYFIQLPGSTTQSLENSQRYRKQHVGSGGLRILHGAMRLTRRLPANQTRPSLTNLRPCWIPLPHNQMRSPHGPSDVPQSGVKYAREQTKAAPGPAGPSS